MSAHAVQSCQHAEWCFEDVDGERVCRECERIDQLIAQCGDRLVALQRRGDELVAFSENERSAATEMSRNGTSALVAELQEARRQKRRMQLGTINTLILLTHIDRLEAELSKPPLVKE